MAWTLVTRTRDYDGDTWYCQTEARYPNLDTCEDAAAVATAGWDRAAHLPGDGYGPESETRNLMYTREATGEILNVCYWPDVPGESAADSYTVQRHRQSGDRHALRYHGDRITGISAALAWREAEQLAPEALPTLDYGPYAGTPDGLDDAGQQQWHAPEMRAEATA